MNTIWKFKLEIGEVTISLPKGSHVLKADIDNKNDEPAIWVAVNTSNDLEHRRFRIFGTGHEIPEEWATNGMHIDTFQSGPFVWHLYEYVPRHAMIFVDDGNRAEPRKAQVEAAGVPVEQTRPMSVTDSVMKQLGLK